MQGKRVLALTTALAVGAASSALADDLAHNSYDVTKLTSDIAGKAQNTDAVCKMRGAWRLRRAQVLSGLPTTQPDVRHFMTVRECRNR